MKTFFSNIWNAILNYKYKSYTLMGLALFFVILGNVFLNSFTEVLEYVSTISLFLWVFYGIYKAIKNTWGEGDNLSKIVAIVFGILGTSLALFIAYLVFTHIKF